MPALMTCEGNRLQTQWNVGSDDFVLPALLTIVMSLLTCILVMAALSALWLSPECTDSHDIPPLLYYSFFLLLAIEVAIMIDEAIIMSVSYRGRIWNPKPRNVLARYIYIRIALTLLEFAAGVVCSVATFNPHFVKKLNCNSDLVAVALAEVSTVIVWFKIVVFQVRMCLFLDPCGCFTPGLLQHLSFLDTADETGETPTPFLRERADSWLTRFLPFKRPTQLRHNSPASGYVAPTSTTTSRERTCRVVRFWERQVTVSQNIRGGITPEEFTRQISRIHRNHIGLRRMERRLRVLFCFLCVGGHRSRGIALDDIARALYTLFDFEEEETSELSVRLVLSDVIAGFKLLNRYQTNKTKTLMEGERLEDKFRKVTFDHMPLNQKPHYQHKPPRPFKNEDPKCHLLVDNMIHYMRHAMGMYGWPLHVFSNMTCGLCQLASKTCCECQCVRPHDPERIHGEDCCMCGVAAIRQQTSIAHDDVYYMSMDNAIYKAPFIVSVDRNINSVVVSIRGTLSIKDALTDMSYSMQYVEIGGVNETYVHKGMYAAADEIRKTLLGKTLEEIRLEALRKLSGGEESGVSEKEVETTYSRQRRLLQEIFSKDEFKDFQLIIAGHSLGAGVASVLALLLRKHYPDLHCYAFSPPGCVFSYPLARYSRRFTTSVVLGNDVVPRISFRSLLYLKQSVKHLLETCDRPKCEVIFLPKWCHGEKRSECKTETSLPEDFENQIVSGETTDISLQNAVFPPATISLPSPSPSTAHSSRQQSMDLLNDAHAFARNISDHLKNTSGKFMPTFPPGKIFHLKVSKSAKQCFLGCCYPNELEMKRLRNEDLCMIMIDHGVVEDHLPNHVLDSLVQFKQKCLLHHYNEEEVKSLREDKNQERHHCREAREQTNKKGQWVFPKSSDVTAAGHISSDEPMSATSSEMSDCPSLQRNWSKQLSHGGPLATVYEDYSSDSEEESFSRVNRREVSVEIHSEQMPSSSRTERVSSDSKESVDEDNRRVVSVEIHSEQIPRSSETESVSSDSDEETFYEINSRDVSAETHNEQMPTSSGTENVSNKTRTGVDIELLRIPSSSDRGSRADDEREDESDTEELEKTAESEIMQLPPFRIEPTKARQARAQVSISEDPPTSIPVQLPYSPPQASAPENRPRSGGKPKKLSLPLRQNSASANFRRKLLPQLSRGSTTPTKQVVTLQARRGFKLKLKLPPSNDLQTTVLN